MCFKPLIPHITKFSCERVGWSAEEKFLSFHLMISIFHNLSESFYAHVNFRMSNKLFLENFMTQKSIYTMRPANIHSLSLSKSLENCPPCNFSIYFLIFFTLDFILLSIILLSVICCLSYQSTCKQFMSNVLFLLIRRVCGISL